MLKTWLTRGDSPTGGLPLLDLPTPHAGCHPLALTAPAELRRWLAELPTANAVAACRQLAQQLSLLVRCPGPLPRLPALLALLECHVEPLAAQVDAHIRSDPDRTEQVLFDDVVAWFGALNAELAQLRKRHVNDLLEGQRGALGEALCAAMHTLSRQIRLDLSGYHGTPPNTWRDMLQLYETAGFLQLARHSLGPPESAGRDLHRLFFGALLYQLADPLRLPPRASWALYDEALAAAAEVDFVSGPAGPGSVVIDATGAVPPLAGARHPPRQPPRRRFVLPLGRLLEAAGGDTGYDRLAECLRTLEPALNPTPGRRQQRQIRDCALLLHAGFAMVHRRLAAIRRRGRAPEGDVAVAQGVACRQLDDSAAGAALVVERRRHAAVQIGDLVLLEHPAGDPARGFVARVRRLRLREPGRLEIGVEKLPGRIAPAQLLGEGRDGRALLHREPAAGRLELYGPAARLAVGAELELEVAGATLRLQVLGERERGPHLARVSVRRLT
jgi:hypothetical protein